MSDLSPPISDALDLLSKTRVNIKNVLSGLSDQQLLTVPPGCSDNILWNLGHIVVTARLLTRGLSGCDLDLPAELVAGLRKGSSPVIGPRHPIARCWSTCSIAHWPMSMLILRPIASLNSVYETSYGVTLSSAADAIVFNNAHEALHLGVMMAYRHQKV